MFTEVIPTRDAWQGCPRARQSLHATPGKGAHAQGNPYTRRLARVPTRKAIPTGDAWQGCPRARQTGMLGKVANRNFLFILNHCHILTPDGGPSILATSSSSAGAVEVAAPLSLRHITFYFMSFSAPVMLSMAAHGAGPNAATVRVPDATSVLPAS
jgi:hypothetical protein